MLDRLLDMLSESTLISGLLAVVVVGTVAYLAISDQPIPETVAGMALTVIAFFFGSKVGRQSERINALMKAQRAKEKQYNDWVQSSGQ